MVSWYGVPIVGAAANESVVVDLETEEWVLRAVEPL